MSDSRGGIHDPEGLDVPAIIEQKQSAGRLPDVGSKLESGALLELDVDVLIAAALEDQIREDNAGKIQADVVLELANGPTTGEADAILHDKGKLVVPDVLANAGGVTVSWFEWLQNRAGAYWDQDEVQEKLRVRMQNQFEIVHERMQKKDVPMRAAAYAVALERLGSALNAGGIAADYR